MIFLYLFENSAKEYRKGLSISLFYHYNRIYASGASGGAGHQNFVHSKADQIRALVKLTKGEQLFILIGQMGVSGCKKDCKAIKVSCKYIFLSLCFVC